MLKTGFVTYGLPLVVSAAIAAAVPVTARAALPPLDEQPTAAARIQESPLVRRAQKALSKLGLYLGPDDGVLDRSTEAAIRIYQRAKGLDTTGRITLDLVGKLEYDVGVRKLMRQLEDARSESIKDARSKLMSHPATRDLMKDARVDEAADPTRDSATCFDAPTTRCLLAEALESAKAIAKAELRDWALGEILIAEARAGLGDKAMETAARIKDPRLVMVALRDIAEAQAAAGRPEDAMAAAAIIPDFEKQADAFAAIAAIQVRRGDFDDARNSLARLLSDLSNIGDVLKQIAIRTRAAVLYAGAGARDDAETELKIAENAARNLPRDSSKSAGIRHVASALAEMEETARALEMLESVTSPSDRIPVLMSAAEAQARAGDAAAALATASGIENVRYRAVLLGRIALAQAQAGRISDADTTLELAFAAIEHIDRPYARSFAVSRIALALTQVHGGTAAQDAASMNSFKTAAKRAIDAAGMIEDRRLNAHTLWLIAARQRVVGDDGWEQTEELAQKATDEVTGDLSRVWMFADIAEGHAISDENEAGWRAFERGIAIARNIDNAWSRSRTLAKLAATLISLVDPGRGRSADIP
ncbi:MAG: peptidoglycan-binding protein [Rhodospirillales bacterium]|nr:peptidoglycan-binding protein [Rhodospirillales bacterium]MBO6785646.1 peptidoglycan-binding protein [Rhodospirillales bacterium]